MKTFFYNRSLLAVIGTPIPQAFLGLDDAYDACCSNYDKAHRLHLAHAENLARRYGDIVMYGGEIRSRYASHANPFEDALFIGSYLVGYYASAKSLLDAVAATLATMRGLTLKPMNVDLCRDHFWTALEKASPSAAQRYAPQRPFFSEVNKWRNHASHVATPLVMVSGPTSARAGKSPAEIPRKDVSIVLASAHDFGVDDLVSKPSTVKWFEPTKHVDDWEGSIASLIALVCEDLGTHIRSTAAAGA